MDRRWFMTRAAALVPIMHAGGLFATPPSGAGGVESPPRPPSPPTARFARLRLRTNRMDEMVTFYRDTLRVPVTREKDVLVVTAGETAIEFSASDPASQPYYHFAFNIPHNTLDAAMKWLEPRCPLVKLGNGTCVAHFPAWDAHAVYFLDPSGNILEFIARHTLKNDAGDPSKFSERDILCASEIGVVALDVIAAADALCAGTKLARYRGGSADFTAVGDEHGLFIVVKTGRRWFSSDRAAEVFPAETAVRSKSVSAPLALSASAFNVMSTAEG